MLPTLDALWGRLLAGLALIGCLLLLAMMLIIVADVALRNLASHDLARAMAWSNEVVYWLVILIPSLLFMRYGKWKKNIPS